MQNRLGDGRSGLLAVTFHALDVNLLLHETRAKADNLPNSDRHLDEPAAVGLPVKGVAKHERNGLRRDEDEAKRKRRPEREEGDGRLRGKQDGRPRDGQVELVHGGAAVGGGGGAGVGAVVLGLEDWAARFAHAKDDERDAGAAYNELYPDDPIDALGLWVLQSVGVSLTTASRAAQLPLREQDPW